MNDELIIETEIAEIQKAIDEIKTTNDNLGLNLAEEDLRYHQGLLNQIQSANTC